MAVPQKTFIWSSQVMNHAYVRMSPKQSNSPPCGWLFEPKPNPMKIVCGKITSKQMVACFFGKTGHVATFQLEHRRPVNSEWYTTICLPKVFVEIRKKRRWLIVHHDNLSCHTSAQSSAFLTERRIAGSAAVGNDFRHQMILLECSKTLFLGCLNRSGKTDTNDGRTTKSSFNGNVRLHLCQAIDGRPETHRSTLVLLLFRKPKSSSLLNFKIVTICFTS